MAVCVAPASFLLLSLFFFELCLSFEIDRVITLPDAGRDAFRVDNVLSEEQMREIDDRLDEFTEKLKTSDWGYRESTGFCCCFCSIHFQKLA